MELSTLIDSIKDEIGRLAKAIKKQKQDLDDLEQYGRLNCLILHGNSLDHRISNRETEKYVISTINSRLDLPFIISEKDINICYPLHSKSSKKPIIIKFVCRSVQNSVYATKKNLKKSEGPKLSIIESLTKRRLHILEEARKVFDFENIWTMKGTVYCAYKGKKYSIKTLSDISKTRFS